MKELALLLLTLAVAQASVSVTRTSNDGPHPTEMEIEVKLSDSKIVRIPLTRTDAFENIPMTVVEKGVSRTFSSSQVHHPSHSHYRDIESKSVISVRKVNGKRQISGHVMHEGTSYFLAPVGASDHKVTKNVRKDDSIVDKQIDLGKVRMSSRRKRQVAGASTTYVVELHLLLDSTVHAAFVDINGSAAMTELHQYYTHILNGIDTAYRNIGTPSISVVCIGLTVSVTPSDDVWMAGGDLDGSAILTSLKSYATGRNADHYMAFTRKDITGGGSSSVCGMAYVKGVCNSLKVSINEDQGLHSWGTAAHELAHNLGSYHDGSNNNGCDPDKQNLMAPSSAIYSIANVANSYRFSSCSVGYMTDYLNTMGSSSCVRSAQGSRSPDVSVGGRIGARMTLDQVCRLAYPSSIGKFMISSSVSSNPAQICASIYCLMTQYSGSSGGGLRAPVGTHCGNKKSCNWNGQCTSDPSAEPADESCFWGDSWPSSNCQGWHQAIVNKWDTCNDSVKRGCCKTLADVC